MRARWLDVVLDVLDGFTPGVPWDPICHELGHQLDAPVTGEFRWGSDGTAAVRAYPFPDWFDLPDVAARAPDLHPLARHYSASGSTEVLSTGGVPADQSAAARAYREELRVCGIQHHLWIPVAVGLAEASVVGVCRGDREFSARDRALGRVAQQVVKALNGHSLVLDRWNTRCAAGRPADLASDLHLTPRQIAVLCLAAEGLTSMSIGSRLSISPRTVERHLQNAYERMGVRDRVSAVRRAAKAGLIPSAT